jgi:endonuclease/exonuclease/phosphatase family metal-dependent hydrolase
MMDFNRRRRFVDRRLVQQTAALLTIALLSMVVAYGDDDGSGFREVDGNRAALSGVDFELRVMAFNLGGYVLPRNIPNIRERMRRIEIEDPDILVLQEVRDDGLANTEFSDLYDELRALLRFSDYQLTQTFPDSRSLRLVLSKYPIVGKRISGSFPSGADTTSEFTISVRGQHVRLQDVHFHPLTEDPALTSTRLNDYVDWLAQGDPSVPLISAGDFNQPVDNNPQYWGRFGTSFDHVCALHPSAVCNANEIDHIFLEKRSSTSTTPTLTVADARNIDVIEPDPNDSDHYAVLATFEGIKGDRGPLRVNSQTLPGVGVAADGRNVVCARGRDNQLWCSDQIGAGIPDALSLRCFSSKGGALASNPVVELSITGRTKAFVVGTDANVWSYDDVLRSTSLPLLPFSFLGGGPVGEGTNPVLAQNADGRLQLFVVHVDNTIWTTSETTGGAWTPWQNLGGVTWFDPAVARNQDDRLELFATGTDRAIWHNTQTAPGSTSWSGWYWLGGMVGEAPVVAAHHDGRLELFTHEVTKIGTYYGTENFKTTGTLLHLAQLAPNGPWRSISTPFGLLIYDWQRFDGQTFGRPAVIENGDTNLLDLVVTGTDNVTYIKSELATGEWAAWRTLYDGAHRPVGPPVVGKNQLGVTLLWMQDTSGKLPRWTSINGGYALTSDGSDYCAIITPF